MASKTEMQGGGRALDVERSKFSWPATATTQSIATGFKRIVDYHIAPFPGTFANGVSVYPTIQGTLDGTATGVGFGFEAGTSGTNAVTLQRPGTAAAAITYICSFFGNG